MVSRVELMEEAKKLKIKGRSTMKKAELEEAIKRAKEDDDDMPQFLKDAEADLARTREPKRKTTPVPGRGRGRPKKVQPPPPRREPSPSPMSRKGAPKRKGAAPLKQRPGRY